MKNSPPYTMFPKKISQGQVTSVICTVPLKRFLATYPAGAHRRKSYTLVQISKSF